MRAGFHLAVLVLVLISLSLISPVQADPIPARSGTVAAPPSAGKPAASDGQDNMSRIIAMSLGAVVGATVMGVFIDGWVMEVFTSGGLSMRQAASVVQDLDSQGGFEAAAIMMSGFAGGLAADHLHSTAYHLLPDLSRHLDQALVPVLAVGRVAAATGRWIGDRFQSGHDWTQARGREWLDRGREWLENQGVLSPEAPPMGN